MSWFDHRPPDFQVKINLKGVHPHQCLKPNCNSRVGIQRHHKGSERMWIRHFKHLRRTKKYQAFKARYEEFRPEDTGNICIDHHEEVHELYEIEQGKFLAEHPELFRKFSTWEWKDAELLMNHFRKVFDEWVRRETPGSKGRRFCRGAPAERRKDAKRRFGPK